MGCGKSQNNTRIIKDTHVPDPLSLNKFPYWYQVFDFLDFQDLLRISPVCKIFHDHTGNTKILKKFQTYILTENSITDCEPTKKEISIDVQNNSEIEPTPSFRSPVEGTQKHFFFGSESRRSSNQTQDMQKKHFVFGFESRRSSAHNVSDSLDHFLPSSHLKSLFAHDPIMEVSVHASAEFKKEILEPIIEVSFGTEFENFKNSLWQSIQNCDSLKLRELIRCQDATVFLRDERMDLEKGNEKISVLAGAVCTMCYVMVKVILEYVPVDGLDRGITIETQENKSKVTKRFTPLQLACARGIVNIVKSLLAKGASAHISGVFQTRLGLKDTITDMGSPALAVCVNKKLQQMHMGDSNFITKFEPEDRDYYQCAIALLEYSANPDIHTMIPMYPTPLFLAVHDNKFLKLLLQYGANPNWTNVRGQTPLYVLSEKSSSLECFQTLIDAGAQIDPTTCRPLFVAIHAKNEKVVQFLKQQKAEINGTAEVPSALQVAISGDDFEMCSLILSWPELQIDWQYQQNGKNMFHRIAVNSGLQVFELLVKNRLAQDLKEIKKALNTATSNDPFQSDTIPLFFALNDLKLSQRYVDFGSDVKRLNLVKCFLENNIEKQSLMFLIENGADVNCKFNQKNLIWAAYEKGRVDLILMFVKEGVDVDSENSLGQSLLHDACFKGNDTIAKILIQEGAKVEKECLRGLKAIDYVKAYYPKKSKGVQEKLGKLIGKTGKVN